MTWTPSRRMACVAVSILVLDQLTKGIVIQTLPFLSSREVLPGFFRFVHWGNTGGAWSFFHGSNTILAGVSLIALIALILLRQHFNVQSALGQVALGLMCGGIAGNVFDRLHPARRHVIDFLCFYVDRRDGSEAVFPAFNVADSAICVGVGLLFLLSWRREPQPTGPAPAPVKPGAET